MAIASTPGLQANRHAASRHMQARNATACAFQSGAKKPLAEARLLIRNVEWRRRHPGESRDPGDVRRRYWIPAFAGMTQIPASIKTREPKPPLWARTRITDRDRRCQPSP